MVKEFERKGNVKMTLIEDELVSNVIRVKKQYLKGEEVWGTDEIYISKEDWEQIGKAMNWN